ncbi:MAG: acyl-CoA reductase [Gemmatimonadota bacterium]
MKPSFDAWYLPGLDGHDLPFATYELGELNVRAPALSPAQLSDVLTHIVAARERTLRSTPVNDIVEAIAEAAHSIEADWDARDLLCAVTGYSRATVEDTLRHMCADWRRPALEALLRSELSDPAVLDTPVRDHTGAITYAIGPRLAFHIFSGNVPGVAVTSIARSLLVKAATLGKTASGEPVLPVLFARALAQCAPAIGACLAVAYWPGGSADLEQLALSSADVTVVYGSAETVSSVANRMPAGTRLVEHGPKLSLGLVARDAELSIAADIARATAAYDQQGCVSPHIVYVETGGQLEPRLLAAAIAQELGMLAPELPRRSLSAAEALAIRAARTRAEFRASAGAPTEVFGSEDTSHTVIYDAATELTASCLNRTLYVKPIENVHALATLLFPHRGLIQSVALAGYAQSEAFNVSVALAQVGVTRITSFAQLPWPPMSWHHDGRGPLRELLTWQDIEL